VTLFRLLCVVCGGFLPRRRNHAFVAYDNEGILYVCHMSASDIPFTLQSDGERLNSNQTEAFGGGRESTTRVRESDNSLRKYKYCGTASAVLAAVASQRTNPQRPNPASVS
jgi:hypothetical protein